MPSHIFAHDPFQNQNVFYLLYTLITFYYELLLIQISLSFTTTYHLMETLFGCYIIPLDKNYSAALHNTTPLQKQFCTHS